MTPALRSAIALLLSVGALAAARPSQSGVPEQMCRAFAQDMVWIPGGKTRIGDDQGYADEGPSYETTVQGVWMDAHEVTNAQFARFVAATGYVTMAERRGEGIVFRPPGAGERPVAPGQWWKIVSGADWRHPLGSGSSIARRANWPVVQVAYVDAEAYARWAGRSLPDEEQFERAASAGTPFQRSQPAPTDANTWQGAFPTNNAAIDGYRGMAPVGCYRANAYGLYDVLGNVWEWTRSWYLPGHGAAPVGGAPGNPSYDPNQPGVRARVIKGGSFLCTPNYCARYRSAARHANDEYAGASHLGFRTVDTVRPPPSSTPTIKW